MYLSGVPRLLNERVLQLPRADHHSHDGEVLAGKYRGLTFQSENCFSGGLQPSDRPGAQVS